MNDLAIGILSKLKVPDRRSIAEWAEGNVILPSSKRSPGVFRADTAPWLIEPLNSVRDTTLTSLLKTTQGGGTVLGEVALTYWTAEAPADTAIVAQTDDDAEKLFREKFLKTLKASPATAALFAKLPRHAIRKDSVALPSMSIAIHGPGEKSTQSASLERVIVDEVWLLRLLAKSALQNMRERGTASPATFRLVCISQAGEEIQDKKGNPVQAEWQEHWESGTRELWHFRCPNCGERFEPLTEHFSAPDSKDENGQRIWAKVAANTILTTPCCSHVIRDTETNRRALATGGKYIQTNPNPMPGHRSFHFPCWTVYWQSWGDLLIQFFRAQDAFKRGDISLLRDWRMKKEAKFMTLKEQEVPSFLERKFFGYKMADFAGGIAWEGALLRLMSVDMQTDCFKCLIRDIQPGGSSRLIWQGSVKTWGDVAALQARYRVPDYRVGVDSSNWQQEVWRECATRKWLALEGSPSKRWRHVSGKSTIFRPFSPVRSGRVAIARKAAGGRPAQPAKAFVYEWSNLYFKDWLSRLIAGQGLQWEYADDVEEEYIQALDSEARRTGADGKPKWERVGKRPNHFWDCECMILAMAQIIGAMKPDLAVFAEMPVEDDAAD